MKIRKDVEDEGVQLVRKYAIRNTEYWADDSLYWCEVLGSWATLYNQDVTFFDTVREGSSYAHSTYGYVTAIWVEQ